MTSKDMMALMECERKYCLRRLSLKGRSERHLCFREAIRRCAGGIATGKDTDTILEEVGIYLQEAYREEWFPLTWQREKAVREDAELLRRFLGNFPLEKEIREEDTEILADISVKITASICCNDTEIDTVAGHADLLLKQADGRITGVILCRKFARPYSYRARKEENKVMGSIELLVLMEGLKIKFPESPVRVMMVQMVSPSDKVGELAVFERRTGENIIQFSDEEFTAIHPEGVAACIQKLAENAELAECSGCFFEGICKSGNKIHVRREEKGTAEGKKEIRFSEIQQKVIEHTEGPIRVCAGPGSGKTAVLVERAKHLITKGVMPGRILAITFTKKAAQEMADRIGMEDGPVVSTLHALAFHILREHEYLVGPVRLAGTVDCKRLLLQVLEQAAPISGVSYEGLTMRYGLISTLLKDFDFIMRNGEEKFRYAYPRKDTKGILRVKEAFDTIFRMLGYITFDDQITMAVRLLTEHPGILETVQSTFDYVMVDEVQDLDVPQAEFVRLLVRGPKNNLMICGDADQSIYSFRGGSNQFMLDFPEIYPESDDCWLENNYRSSMEIIKMADSLIARNKKRVPIEPKATYRTGFNAIHIPYFKDSRLPELVMEIKQKGYAYEDIAVIARTNKNLLKLCEAADRAALEGGPVIPIERPKFYLREDFVFRTVLDLLELSVKGMRQDEALYRLLAGMGCEVTKTNKSLGLYDDHLQQGLIYEFTGEEASMYFLPCDEPLRNAYGKIYCALQKLKLPVRKALKELRVFFFSEDICTEEVFEELDGMVYEKKIASAGQLYKAMEAMTVFEDDRRIYYESADRNQVHMLTAHDAKGKEFPVVIIYGIDDFEGDDVEEDRRLLYVALTRAKRVLFILESYAGKSLFLKEILEYVTVNRRERYEK